ncbi:MAG: hypothetical protein HBSAPP03_13670 [Phycisphaerae bacterium]|nr:MAG: hypothetical protein HBSAPP03_13670 [Phycisphaerae bacterium]
MNRNVQIVVLLAVLVAGFFAVNLIAGRLLTGLRLDATEGRVYTLTAGSRAVAKSPDEPVTLTFYFSSAAARGQPDLESYARRVRELLGEYARASGGKVVVKVVDPEPYAEAEDDAVKAGLAGLPMPSGVTLYFGLVGVNSVETREVIPFFDMRKERFLEYDLSRLIYALANPKKRVVGLLSGLPLEGGFAMDPRTRQPTQTPPWRIVEEMKTLYDVRTLDQPDEIPADVDVLVVVHPKELKERTQYAIDQFVLRGGRLLAFIDPLCENDQVPGMAVADGGRGSNLTRLMDAWGVEMPAETLAADDTLALRVYVGSQQNPEAVPYVVWLGCDDRALSKDDAITGSLKQMILGTAGVIRAKEGVSGGLTITPIIQTTATATTLPASALGLQPDPKALMKQYTPGKAALTLTARLHGKAKSAFPEGPAGGAGVAGLRESAGDVNVILVADCDLLSDAMWVRIDNFLGQRFARKVSDNGDFVLSALDNLMGSADLIAVRARRDTNRPFTVVEEMRRKADKAYLAELDVLEAKERDATERLRALQAKRDDADKGVLLTPEQQAEITKLRAEQVATRKSIREVKRRLRADIDTLGAQLKFINVALVPLLVAVFAVGLGLARRVRRARPAGGAAA